MVLEKSPLHPSGILAENLVSTRNQIRYYLGVTQFWRNLGVFGWAAPGQTLPTSSQLRKSYYIITCPIGPRRVSLAPGAFFLYTAPLVEIVGLDLQADGSTHI
jgi:hypothetical protein